MSERMTARKRQALEMRSRIQSAALDLFDREGFENVSVEEIAQTVRAGLHFIPVDTVDQVFAAALVPSRGEHAAPRGRVSAESPAAQSV